MQNTSDRFSSNPSPRRVRGRLHTASTSRQIRDLLPSFLNDLGKLYHSRPDLVLAAWPLAIGSKLAPMTEALSFIDGILTVKVKNSTLYSLLSGQDKPRILKNLKEQLSGVEIKTIHFRL